MIKSPLRYPGGKSRAVKTIAKLLPDLKNMKNKNEQLQLFG